MDPDRLDVDCGMVYFTDRMALSRTGDETQAPAARPRLLRLFLGASAAIWIPYGVYCFLQPGMLAEAAGVSASGPTGTIELRAMYGGLQIALGVLAASALVRNTLVRPALIALAFLCAGLFTARLLGVVLGLEVSSYTAMGLLFEILSSGFATRLLDQLRRVEPA